MSDKTRSHSPISPQILLSLATSPFLLLAIASEALTSNLIAIGQVCEELFRGDRLPILHVPEVEETKNE